MMNAAEAIYTEKSGIENCPACNVNGLSRCPSYSMFSHHTKLQPIYLWMEIIPGWYFILILMYLFCPLIMIHMFIIINKF